MSTARPTRGDHAVCMAAFDLLWPALWKWVKGLPNVKDEGEMEWKNSAHEVLRSNYEVDGYRLAKDFEDAGWSVDADLVDVLDEWDHHLYTALKNATEAWIAKEGVTAKLAIGTKVKVNAQASRYKHPEIHDGEITSIDMKRGVYHVFIPALGHVRPGGKQCGTTGLLFEFDVLEKQNA